MKIGIITIHKINNFGSALQAYALQQFLKMSGYDNQIIDYHWTWEHYNPNLIQRFYLWIKMWTKNLLKPNTSYSRFFRFHLNYFDLTKKEYTKHNINKCPPKYDLYITGSDQVWNCRFTDGDANFLLQFAPDGARRISYAASFASPVLPEKYSENFAELLAKYEHITVREKSGADIVKGLIGKEAKVVCDPTLLLTSDDYSHMACNSKIIIEDKYILVYLLDYMFDPYPHVNKLIENVGQVFENYKMVYLRCSKQCKRFGNYINVEDAGPLEFLYLMQHASFVITTSFHGTAFAAIFKIPLLAIVQDKRNDGRIQTLLKELHQSDSVIDYNELPSNALIKSSAIVTREINLNKLRNDSIEILIDMIKK